MKVFCFVALFLLVSRTLAQEEEEYEKDGESNSDSSSESQTVITLSQDNFTESVQDERIILVEFYAPWCGHCKKLEPEYELAAQTLQEDDIPLAKVDATANEELARKYGIQGYPTMKIFRKGTVYDYDGPRQADGIVEYMRDQARPDWEPPLDRVMVLTADNFDEVVNGNPLVLVEFYAPWCGHCKNLAPEYTKAANILHDKEIDVILAKVDATTEKDLAAQYDVQGFPTMKIFRHGRLSDYNGPREARGIAEYMFKQALPPSIPLRTANDVQSRIKSQTPLIIGFFESTEEDAFLKFSDAASEGREDPVAWFHTTDPRIADTLNIEFGTVAVFMPKPFYNKVEKKIKRYSGPYDMPATDLKRTLIKMATPLVGLRTEANSNGLYSNPLLLVGYISGEDEEDSFGYWRDKLMVPLAVKYPDIQFAISDERAFSKEIQNLLMHDRGDDLLIGIFDKENNKRYAYPDDDTSVDAVEDFIEAFKDGELKPTIRSQSVRNSQEGAVKVVVGSNFRDIVEDPEKDVLIEFYAPWCGHCKALEPIYASLAKKYKKNDKLVIAKLDATENEYPDHYSVSGFPTIYFVSAGEKPQIVKFEGERKTKEFVKFLKKYAKFSLGESSSKSSKDEL